MHVSVLFQLAFSKPESIISASVAKYTVMCWATPVVVGGMLLTATVSIWQLPLTFF